MIGLSLALPEIIILAGACIVLLADLFFNKRQITLFLALLTLVVSGSVAFSLLDIEPQAIFHGLFIADNVAMLAKLMVAIVVFLCFVYSHTWSDEHEIRAGDFYVLGLFSTLGMMVLISAGSMITIYLGLELLSLPLYAMVAMHTRSGDGSEAAMKYFVMGALTSAMLLYGISMLYGASGTMELSRMATALASSDKHGLLLFGMVFVIAGVGFKLTAVPFHMWTPDVYQGAPVTATMFISSAPKIAALCMAWRLLAAAMPALTSEWQQLIMVMAVLSALIGNLLAIVQTNIRRLFAWSTISHMGYALFGILAATPAGYAAALYYVIIYALMSAAMFGALALMSHKKLEVENVSDLRGLNQRNPWLALLLMVILFAMAGVPPTVGFFIKLFVLKALVEANMLWVAVAGLVFAVIGAYYYIRIIRVMYFDDADNTAKFTIAPVPRMLLSVNCLALLYLGIFPTGLVNACMQAFQ